MGASVALFGQEGASFEKFSLDLIIQDDTDENSISLVTNAASAFIKIGPFFEKRQSLVELIVMEQ